MSKFLNKTYANTVEHLVSGGNEKLKNPFYGFIDKGATIGTYYNLNTHESTLDADSKMAYAYHGKASPLKYNKIEKACVYGFNKVELDIDITEDGPDSSPITGEFIIPPNVFKPMAQDYFIIDYVKKKFAFKITKAIPDTLSNGANCYKAEYQLSLITEEEIEELNAEVVDTFVLTTVNDGTNTQAVLEKKDYSLIDNLEDILYDIKDYFYSLFYKNRIQTFIYEYSYMNLYDPYMIEFLRRNKILTKGDDIIYVDHKVIPSQSFAIDYANTFFRTLEKRDTKHIRLPLARATKIIDKTSSLYYSPEDFYEVLYHENSFGTYSLEIIDQSIIEHIKNNTLYDEDTFLNLIVRYMNKVPIDDSVIDTLNNMVFRYDFKTFYAVPITIFCVEQGIKDILSK